MLASNVNIKQTDFLQSLHKYQRDYILDLFDNWRVGQVAFRASGASQHIFMEHIIQKNILHIKERIKAACKRAGRNPKEVQLLLATKTVEPERILQAFACGCTLIGENKVQELRDKYEALSAVPHTAHFIGHLQSNKVKYIAPYISMIEAVDTLKLLKEINKQAAKHNRIINVLLELHIAEEDSKYGFSIDDCRKLLEEGELRELKNVHISGLMMMASNTDDTEQIRKEMTLAANFFDEVKAKYFADDPEFKERSWGMSSDYEIAIDCRSTMIRVGTAIFGPRVY